MIVTSDHINNRIPEKPPVILPVKEGIKRPLWSVMIPAYNCSSYLKETLEGVLRQAPHEDLMQIEVIDDASTDSDVKKLVTEIGKGRIKYFRQLSNVGSLRNFQTCIERSNGHFIHILHGDDLVRKDFYKKFEIHFNNHPDIGAAHCRYAYINENGKFLSHHEQQMKQEGILKNSFDRLCIRNHIQYVSIVVRRKVYEELGSFYGVEYGEDWEMWVRVASRYKIGYLPEVLAEYRRHLSSISGKSFVSAGNMYALNQVMNKIQHYLPNERKAMVLKRSQKFYAHYALRVAEMLWAKLKNRNGAEAQMKAAWEMSSDTILMMKIVKLYMRMALKI